MPMNTPSVSVIVCTCDRPASLRRTLQALSCVEIPATIAAELLVVDNGTRTEAGPESTADVVASCALPQMPIRYMAEPRRGQCHARNSGVAAAQGDVIIFTDDDVQPPPTWLQAMCGPIFARQCQAVAGGVRLAHDLERPWMGVLHQDWLASTEHERPGAPIARVGANMAFSRSVLAQVPWFDTELGPGALGFGDDTLFLSQLERAGYRICQAGPESVIVHQCESSRLSRSSLLASAAKHGRSGAYLAHHWEHRDFPHPTVALARARLRLAAWRLRRGRQWTETEGCPEWELQLTRDVSFFRQSLDERHRLRAYDRHGLVKKRASGER